MSAINSFTGETITTTPPEPSQRRAARDWGSIIATALAGVMLLCVAWMEKVAWEKINFAEHTIVRAYSASLSSGVKLQESIASLKLSLLLFQVSGEDENRNSFSSESRRVSALLAQSLANAASSQERSLLSDIDSGLKTFLSGAEDFVPVKAIRRGTIEKLTADLERALEPTYRATASLVELQKQIQSRLQTDSALAFNTARRALQSSLVALVVLLGSLAILIHRAFLVPLKSRLVATAAESHRHERLASIGVLATGVAHEIRNPLTAIKFRLFSLKKSLGPNLTQNEDFQTIRSEIDRLELLVKNFLEFARPAEPQFTQINPAELLQDVRSLLEPEMAKKDVNFQVDAAEGLDFRGDRQQLRQVLINLSQNAGDSMPRGGTITLRARSGIAVFADGRHAAMMIEVADTGSGIDPDVQKRLFEPFFSTREGGTGLGLAIAARIVEQHGGQMQFSTRKNQGSTFTIVLPLKSHETTQKI